jgi:hypothetical protein
MTWRRKYHLFEGTRYVDNGKVIPGLNQVLRHEDVWGNGGRAPHILISVLDGCEWSASRSRKPTDIVLKTKTN